MDVRAISFSTPYKVYTCKDGITTQIATTAVAAYLASNPTARLGSCTSVCGFAKDDGEEASLITEDNSDYEFNVRVYPNPFAKQFRINIESVSDETLNIRIFDVLGQLIEKQNGIAYSTDVVLGSTVARGVYILEVNQGDKMKLVRIVKSE